MCPFFGLSLEYKIAFHQEIFNLCYHGKGGFTWLDVYNMPIILRRFYSNQIIDFIENQNKLKEEANKNKSNNAPIIPPMNNKNSYITMVYIFIFVDHFLYLFGCNNG